MDFYQHISLYRKNLNEVETSILEYAFQNKDELQSMSVRKFAESNYVSANTVIRMCKKLNFSGFSEFKIMLLKASPEPKLSYSHQLLLDIDRTEQNLSKELLYQIVDVLITCNKIAIFSTGLSQFVASEMEEYFRIFGRKIHAFTDPNLMNHCAKRLIEKDVVIVFSVSGENESSLDALHIAKSTGAKIISITGMSNNSISKLADYSIFCFCNVANLDGIDTTNRLPFSYISSRILNEYYDRVLVSL
jgi:Transcriptional regulators